MKDSRQYPSIHRWDDLIGPSTAVTKPGIQDPDFDTDYVGWRFDGGALTEVLLYTFQLPHSWEIGTAISPHVHWAKTTSASGNVRWVLEYKWASLNAVADANWSTPVAVTTTVTGTTDTNTAYKTLLSTFGEISTSGRNISDQFMCKLSRTPTHAGDTYGADALMYFFDVHYKSDSIGSTYLYRKTYEPT